MNDVVKKILRESVNALPLWARHLVKYIPGLALFQRWLVSRVLSGQPFVHTINTGPATGLNFEVLLPGDKAVWAGTYESRFSQSLRDAVRLGDTCYDIGGYRGYMAGVLALAGAGRVIVFEPFPGNIAALERLIQLNPKLPLQLEKTALGNSNGTVTFKVMSDLSMGKIGDSQFQPEALYEKNIEVPICQLDEVMRKHNLPLPAVIKIDVEGAEVDVLKGGQAVLAGRHPMIFLEAHSKVLAHECCKILGRLGYSIRQLENQVAEDEAPRHLVAEFRE